MTTKEHFSWLRYVEKALIDLDEIPLLGHAPPFNWDELIDKLRTLLQIPSLSIQPHEWSWKNADAIDESLGSDYTCLNVAVLPIQGHASFLVSSADLNSFVSWVVQHQAGSNALLSNSFSEGLLHFVAMEALSFTQPFSCFEGFMLRILSDQTPPRARALTLDITLKAYHEEIMMRLVLPEDFRSQWMKYFAKRPKTFSLEMKKHLQFTCSLEAAHLKMSSKEWKSVQVGDFLPLGGSNLDLEQNTGSLYLSANQKPLYRVRIKNNGLKILEQPIFQEDTQPMDQEHDDLLSEISDLEQASGKSIDPIPEEMDSDDVESSDQESVSVKEEPSALEKVEMVPLNVSVEVSRFKMTCEKLLQLKPGNLIELNVSLEKPVHLVANGKTIATGELVRIGEMLGVQITEIG